MFLEAQTPGAGGLLGLLMPFVIMLVVVYFFMIRPQQAQQKERQAMLDALKKGDRIITIGGIHGEITKLSEDTVTIRVADKTEIVISKSGVGSVKN
ncbi:MAG: preprotein translocase subunit YajC [Candidatus Wallacebacter cryptica]|jgi:preprotein translocase subunit YajC|nr:preprotein translocase subunit YajC [Bacillota bacterium]